MNRIFSTLHDRQPISGFPPGIVRILSVQMKNRCLDPLDAFGGLSAQVGGGTLYRNHLAIMGDG